LSDVARDDMFRVQEVIMSNSTQDIEAVVQRYLATFNQTDARARRAALDALFTPDADYVDPHVSLKGPAQIDAFVAGVQEKYPGVVFRLGGKVDAHHAQARFSWHAGPAGEKPLAIGFDVLVFDGGRIRQVLGFYDLLPGQQAA
jgi:hypothetical protein